MNFSSSFVLSLALQICFERVYRVPGSGTAAGQAPSLSPKVLGLAREVNAHMRT